MAVRWMEEQNKGEESMKEITEITDYPMSITEYELSTDYNVEFHIDGRRIGRLDFNGGVMVFEGDAEESAKVFFDALAEKFADRLKEEREKEREACARMCEAMGLGHVVAFAEFDCAEAICTRGEKE
jgi:hypothetical protein